MRKLSNWIKTHPVISVIGTLQIVFLLVLVTLCFRPQTVIVSEVGDFIPTEFEGLQIDPETQAYHMITGYGTAEAAETEMMSVPSGAYRVYVEYESISDIENPSYSMKDSTGTLEWVSEVNPAAITGEHIILYDGLNSQESYFWIGTGAKLTDFVCKIMFNGHGKLTIDHITITEVVAYRYLRLAGFLLIFLLFDLFLLAISEEKFSFMGMDRKTFLFFFLIILGASLPLFTNHIYQHDDMRFHIARIESLAQSIKEGQLPVRINQSMIYGYSYANPIFYNSLFLYIPALLFIGGVPLFRCYQIYEALIILLTCFIAYYSFGKMTKSKTYGMLGAALYLYAPYRMMNMYNRGAVGEYTAMAFLPLIIYGFWSIYKKDNKEKFRIYDGVPIILGVSGVISSHLLSTLLVLEFVVIFCIWNWKKTFYYKRLWVLCESLLAILLLNLYWILPFLQSYTMDLHVKDEGNYLAGTGLGLTNLLNQFSYLAGSTLGTGANMSISIGAAAIGAIVLFVFCIWKKIKSSEITQTAVLGIIAVVLASNIMPWGNISGWLGKYAMIVDSVQFAWRYLGIATPLLILAFLLLIKELKPGFEKVSRYALLLVLGISVLATLESYSSFIETNYPWNIYSLNEMIAQKNVATGEYLLQGTELEPLNVRRVTAGSAFVKVGELNYNKGVTTIEVENTSIRRQWVDIPIFAYDNYHVVDENGLEFEISKGISNVIRVFLPKQYKGTLITYYKVPGIWRITELISLATGIIFVGYLLIYRRRKKA